MEEDIAALLICYGVRRDMIKLVREMKADQDRVFYIEYKDINTDELRVMVMKICETRTFEQIDMNLEVIKRLRKDEIPCPIPIVLTEQYQNKYGHEFICKLRKNGKEFKVYCISHIDGILCADIIDSVDMIFYSNLGDIVGRLTKSLFGYKNQNTVIYDDWDIIYIEEMYKKRIKYVSMDKLSMVEYYMNEFRTILEPKIGLLRKSVIHSDLHHHNIFCDKMDNNKIIGIIDFGDLNETCTLFEVSYCCTHFMLNKSKEEGINIMLNIVAAYHKVFALQHIEIDVLFVCICLHALIRVMDRAKDIALYPENTEHWNYYVIPCWKLLKQYQYINHDKIRQLIRTKLKMTISRL